MDYNSRNKIKTTDEMTLFSGGSAFFFGQEFLNMLDFEGFGGIRLRPGVLPPSSQPLGSTVSDSIRLTYLPTSTLLTLKFSQVLWFHTSSRSSFPSGRPLD